MACANSFLLRMRIERNFPVTGKINSGVPAESLTVPVHFLDFRQQNLTQYLTN